MKHFLPLTVIWDLMKTVSEVSIERFDKFSFNSGYSTTKDCCNHSIFWTVWASVMFKKINYVALATLKYELSRRRETPLPFAEVGH